MCYAGAPDGAVRSFSMLPGRLGKPGLWAAFSGSQTACCFLHLSHQRFSCPTTACFVPVGPCASPAGAGTARTPSPSLPSCWSLQELLQGAEPSSGAAAAPELLGAVGAVGSTQLGLGDGWAQQRCPSPCSLCAALPFRKGS